MLSLVKVYSLGGHSLEDSVEVDTVLVTQLLDKEVFLRIVNPLIKH